jgi:hypothetical protein
MLFPNVKTTKNDMFLPQHVRHICFVHKPERRVGVALTAAIIMADVVLNGWGGASYRIDAMAQVAFLIFVAMTVRIARGGRRRVGHGEWRHDDFGIQSSAGWQISRDGCVRDVAAACAPRYLCRAQDMPRLPVAASIGLWWIQHRNGRDSTAMMAELPVTKATIRSMVTRRVSIAGAANPSSQCGIAFSASEIATILALNCE